MIVDVEHHMFTEEQTIKGRSKSGSLVERYADAEGNIRLSIFEAAASVENHLQFMDEAGIDVAVLSRNGELSVEKSRMWNDACAMIIQKHPKRFVGFASISPLGGKPALEELERAVKELGLKGVHIFARSGAHTLDHKEYWPFNYDNDPQGVREYVAEIRKLDLSGEDIDCMLGGNAATLLGIYQNIE